MKPKLCQRIFIFTAQLILHSAHPVHPVRRFNADAVGMASAVAFVVRDLNGGPPTVVAEWSH